MPRVGRAAKGNHIQSVLFNKDFWTKAEAVKWLKDNSTESRKFYTDGFDKGGGQYMRFRQYDPDPDTFRYRNKVVKEEDGQPSIVFVLGFSKKQASEATEKLLKAVRRRGSEGVRFGYGILTADKFVESMAQMVGIDVCYQYGCRGNTSFYDVMQKAARTLCYSDEGMEVEAAEHRFKKLVPKGVKLPKNTLMVFRHKLTTCDLDRDGDIMHPEGALLDPRMLLLWQHTHTMPIGKYLYTARQDEKELVVVSCIVDINDLSHDAAVMIDNDMGRFSHGFRALEFTERKNKDGKPGFEVTSFEIMEESLVSVPANPDADTEEILLGLVDKGKLTSPMLKEYSRAIREHRPKQAPGWSPTGDGTSAEGSKGTGDSRGEKDKEGEAKVAGGKVKDEMAAVSTRPSIYGIAGSFEQVRADLSSALRDFLADAGVINNRNDREWAAVAATFQDYVIAEVHRGDGEQEFYRISWRQGERGAELTGDPQKVEVTETIVIRDAEGKMLGTIPMKAKNVTLYSAGYSQAKSLVNRGKVTKATKWEPASSEAENTYIEEHGPLGCVRRSRVRGMFLRRPGSYWKLSRNAMKGRTLTICWTSRLVVC